MSGESFGAYLRRKRPDVYGKTPEDELNATVRERLASPEGRARLVSKLRENVGFKPTTTDDDILRAAQNSGTPNQGAAAQQINTARTKQGMVRDTRKIKRGVAGHEAAAAAGQPVSPGTREVIEDAKALVPLDSPMELPVVERMGPSEDGPGMTELLARTPGGHIEGTFQKVLVDKDGKGVAALLPGASVGSDGQSGFMGTVDPVNRVTGNRSLFQTAAAQNVRSLANTARRAFGDGGDVSPGESTSYGNTGYGLREAGGDIGGVAGKAASPVTAVLGRGAAGATAGVMKGMAGIDAAEAWALEKAAGNSDSLFAGTLREWAKSNREEEGKYDQLAKDSWDVATWDVPEHAKPFVGEAFGQAAGKTLGEVSSMVAPSDVAVPGIVTKGVGSAARALAPVATAKAVARTAQATAPVRAGLQHVKERAVDWGNEHGLGFVTNRPFAMAHSGVARDTLDTGAMAVKNAPTMAGEAMTREMMDAEASLAKRMGWSKDEFEQFATGAKDRWTSIEARQGASPQEAEIIRLWQPFHERVWRKSASNVKYNPLHDYYGQDPGKAAKILNTVDARKAEQVAGEDAWKATPHEVTQKLRHSTPGLDTLDLKTFKESQPYDVRGRAWKADAIKERMEGNVDTSLPGMKNRAGKWLMTRATRREAEQARDSVMAAMPNTAFGQSLTRNLEGVARAQGDAAAIMSTKWDGLAKADKRFTTLDDLLKSPAHQKDLAGFKSAPPAPPRAYERTGLGKVRTTKKGSAIPVEHLAINKTLRDDGLMVLQVEGKPALSGLHVEAGKTLGEGPAATSMILPKTFGEEWHGRVVPRTWGKAVVESVNLSHAPNSALAKQRARALDKLLGLNQAKRLITIGNMGFDFRNRQSEVLRVISEEGGNAVDRKLLASLAEVSNAPLGRASGKTVKIGNTTWDTGVLHTELRRMGVMRSGITEDAARKFATEAGSGAIAHAVPGLGSGIDAVNKVVMKPGEASSAAADKFARQLFDYEFAGGRGLSPHYRGEDGIRMWSTLAKMKRGQTVEAAARDSKSLLIDYTNKSAFEEYGGVAVPFIKYYLGAARGAVRTAINHPRRFSRAADFARIAENYDRSVEGYGSFDPRDKNKMEELGMFPVVKMGNGRSSLRNEGPAAETASLIDSFVGGDVNPARNLSPLIGGAYATAMGKDIGTGRNIYGLPAKEHKNADAGLYDQWSHAMETDEWLEKGSQLGDHPYGQLMWAIMKNAPIVGGRMMSPQMETAARTAMGLGGGPSSRTVHGSVDALRRSVLSSSGVGRAPPSDPLQERAKRARKVADRMPELILQQQATRKRMGKPTEGGRK